MIELRDTIRIDVPPGTVWAWFESLPSHYRQWHVDHVKCRWVGDRGLAPGARMDVVEVLHGASHHFRLRLTEVVPSRRACYRVAPGVAGCLGVEPEGSGSRFTASVRLGTRAPLIGVVLDAILLRLFGGKIESIRRHQREEGVNLKALLEH